MKFKLLLPIVSLLIFLGGCSASYKQLSKVENKEPKDLFAEINDGKWDESFN